jgi:glycosyltransferase involved in cell wall biosynthesis
VFDFVIPARNEADLIGRLIGQLRSEFRDRVRVVVADNASEDGTAEAAKAAGANEVVHVTRVGKGYAAMAALKSCTTEFVMFCDADISGLERRDVIGLMRAVEARDLLFGRLDLQRSPRDAPVTTLTAIPLLRLFGVDGTREPLGGLMAVRRSFALGSHLPGDWGFDVALTLSSLARSREVVETPAPRVEHRRRDLGDYRVMAEQVSAAILRHFGALPWTHDNCTACTVAVAAG